MSGSDTSEGRATDSVRCMLGRIPELAATLGRLDVRPDALTADATTPEYRDIGTRLRGGGVVVDIAPEGDGRRRLELEVTGRRWARNGGVLTPSVLAVAPDHAWMIGRAVENLVRGGPAFVAAALHAADAIARLPAEPAPVGTTSWRAPRHSLPLRVGRLARYGVSPATFWSTRRAAARLAPRDEVPVHGDFQCNNVLFDASAGELAVVDWEFRGRGRRYTDATRLLATLLDPEDATYGLERLLEEAPPRHRARIAVELRWQALRVYCAEATQPRHLRDEVQLGTLRDRWSWTRSTARNLLRATRSTR